MPTSINIDDIKKLIREALREELTSGDPTIRKMLTELLLSTVLKDSSGAELSAHIKNVSAIKTQTDKLVFDSAGNLKTDTANAEIMVPVDIQSRYKPPGTTLFSGTVTANGNTADIDVSTVSSIRLMLKVTSVGGTSPTLDIYIEGKYEATGDYVPLLSKTGINATGVYELGQLDNLCFRYIRARWVLGGTSPSFGIAVVAQTIV